MQSQTVYALFLSSIMVSNLAVSAASLLIPAKTIYQNEFKKALVKVGVRNSAQLKIYKIPSNNLAYAVYKNNIFINEELLDTFAVQFLNKAHCALAQLLYFYATAHKHQRKLFDQIQELQQVVQQEGVRSLKAQTLLKQIKSSAMFAYKYAANNINENSDLLYRLAISRQECHVILQGLVAQECAKIERQSALDMIAGIELVLH